MKGHGCPFTGMEGLKIETCVYYPDCEPDIDPGNGDALCNCMIETAIHVIETCDDPK